MEVAWKRVGKSYKEWGVLLDRSLLWQLRNDWSTRCTGSAMTSLHEGVEEAGAAEEGVRSWRSEDEDALSGELRRCYWPGPSVQGTRRLGTRKAASWPSESSSRDQFAFTSGEERLRGVLKGLSDVAWIFRYWYMHNLDFTLFLIRRKYDFFFFSDTHEGVPTQNHSDWCSLYRPICKETDLC